MKAKSNTETWINTGESMIKAEQGRFVVQKTKISSERYFAGRVDWLGKFRCTQNNSFYVSSINFLFTIQNHNKEGYLHWYITKSLQ